MHVGDSRLYIVNRSGVSRLTIDHKTDQGAVLCLGSARIEPQIEVYGLYSDALLMLCSDGISDIIDETRIGEVLAGSNNASEAANSLITEALRRQTGDNCTVAIAFEGDYGDAVPAAGPALAAPSRKPPKDLAEQPLWPDAGVPDAYDEPEPVAVSHGAGIAAAERSGSPRWLISTLLGAMLRLSCWSGRIDPGPATPVPVSRAAFPRRASTGSRRLQASRSTAGGQSAAGERSDPGPGRRRGSGRRACAAGASSRRASSTRSGRGDCPPRTPAQRVEAPSAGRPQGRRTKRITYTVQRDNTVWHLGRLFGVTPNDIRSWNGLKGDQYIYPNQKLEIRPPRWIRVITYVVWPGNTLAEIAEDYRVSVQDIRTANGLRRRSTIHPGKELTIRTANGLRRRSTIHPGKELTIYAD